MGARRLAQTLVVERLLSNAQVVAALQRQTMAGGSLDTNILELQLLDESALLGALQKAYSVGCANRADIDSIGNHVARLFPLSFAQAYNIVPMRLLDQTLVVLGLEPPDDATTESIWNQYHLHVAAQVTTEARLQYASQRVYGVAPMPRFTQLLTMLDGFEPTEPWHFGVTPSAPPRSESESVGARLPPPSRSLLKEAIAQLETEPDRDRAVDIVIGFAQTMFDYVGVFVVHSAATRGWRSTRTALGPNLHRINAQLIKDSVLRTICATHSPYLGPLPRHEANERFLAHIERPWPKVACLAPILVGGRLAALLYADNADRNVSAKKVAALMMLIQRCGMAWERLIRARKQGTPRRKRHDTRVDANPAHAHAASLPSPEIHAQTSYVPFGDITDSPQQSLGEWEDVLVEVTQENTPHRKPRTRPTLASWSDVIARAHAAAHLVPQMIADVAADAPHVETLLRALDHPEAATRQNALAQLLNLGHLIDAACREQFPGPLRCDPWNPGWQLPTFGRCSGLCQLFAARGRAVSPIALDHLNSPNRTQRLMAVYFFMAIHDPSACAALTDRLYDVESHIRHLAIETLRYYKNEIPYAHMVYVLRNQLRAGPPDAQRFAILALGQLREVAAVPSLIPLVADTHPETARAAASALAVICGQAFGANISHWQHWWDTHHYQPRPAWLLLGLAHSNATIRRVAHSELQTLTGKRLAFDADANARERQEGAAAWEHWLHTHNIDEYSHPPTVRS